MNYKTQPKILILNQMAGPMTWELAEDLSKEIGCVALLTGHPDTLKKESTELLQLHPAPTYHRGSFSRRAISWLDYCFKAFFWILKYPSSTPVLIFSNPPILLWFVWLIYGIRKQKYAIMVHDIYPDILVRLQGFSEKHLLIRVWRFLNRHAYQKARLVMTLGEYMAANLEKQFDSSKNTAGKVEVVYPWVDTDKIHPIPKEENWFAKKYDQVGKLTVMYSGNMGIGHDIETMLNAAKKLKNNGDIHFIFLGAGPKWDLVKQTISKENLKNVSLFPWQPENILPFSIAVADISLISLKTGVGGLILPSKAIYSMAIGSAIILLTNTESELNNWLINSNSGKIIFSKDTGKLCNLLKDLYENKSSLYEMKKSSRITALTNFSRLSNSKIIYRTLFENLLI